MKIISSNKLTDKEVTVLRIYFTFLNIKDTLPSDSDNHTFVKNVAGIIRKYSQNLQ